MDKIRNLVLSEKSMNKYMAHYLCIALKSPFLFIHLIYNYGNKKAT